MRIKKWAVMALFFAVFFLTGCSNQTASKEASNSSNKSSQSSKSSVKKTSKASSSSAKAVKLDAAKLTPQESGSLITLYCADRFGGEWSNLLQAGQNGSLTITLHKTSDYEFKQPGSGYAYEAAASGQTGTTYYTLSGSTFYFYQGVKVAGSGSSLGQATKQEMADYIVKKNISWLNSSSWPRRSRSWINLDKLSACLTGGAATLLSPRKCRNLVFCKQL